MSYVVWTIRILFWLLVAAFLHYTLPQHDIVRITDTYETRIDYGENSLFWASESSGMAADIPGRDVFFIQARRPSDRPIIYRNEDTGWGWPPYFKFDTSNLQADAADLRSTQDKPIWVAIRHYGWRNELMSIYPNAVGLRRAEGPDETIIPWFNITVLVLLAAIWWAIRVRWLRFRRRRLDPAFEEIGDRADGLGLRLGRMFGGRG